MLALRFVVGVASAGAVPRSGLAIVYFFIELVLQFRSRFQGLVGVPQILDLVFGFDCRVVRRN